MGYFILMALGCVVGALGMYFLWSACESEVIETLMEEEAQRQRGRAAFIDEFSR